jgi:hypothetical protein
MMNHHYFVCLLKVPSKEIYIIDYGTEATSIDHVNKAAEYLKLWIADHMETLNVFATRLPTTEEKEVMKAEERNKWTVVNRYTTSRHRVLQSDGWSCGVITCLIAWWVVLHGRIPSEDDLFRFIPPCDVLDDNVRPWIVSSVLDDYLKLPGRNGDLGRGSW